ncbi:MAG: DUF6067 family protein [Armatimonadota bacterium]|nr:DUF6067 family protein [Armatimonadota bacterium]
MTRHVPAALIAILSLGCAALAAAQPPSEPHPPDARTLLLDHFDQPFEPDGTRMTSPEVITPAGEHTGGRPMPGGEFVEGKFGMAYQLHGETAIYYPAEGNIDLAAGSLEFWVRMGYEPVHPSEVVSERRNQLFFHVDPPGKAHFSVYSTLKNLCVGVWDQRRQLVAYMGTSSPWHEGQWHHVEVRWGRQLELWMDGQRRGVKDWAGLFGPMRFDLSETRMYVGSRVGYSDVVSEFAIDELRILGPGGEQVPPYPRITCPRVTAPPSIDGELSEGEWDGAGAATGFVGLNENLLVEDQSTVFVAHNREALYVAFECTDPQGRPIVATFTDRDSAVYQEDAVDIFLQPGPGDYPYYQLVTNALGTRFDMRLVEENGRRAKQPDFDPDWTVVTSRGEGHWVAEARIPFASLDGRPAPENGTVWRGNFCRDADAASRLSSWAFTAGNFHRISTFGELLFRDDDRAMRLGELSGAREGRLRARLDLTGRAFDPPVTVSARLIDAGAQTVAEAEKELVDVKSFLFEPPSLVSGDYVLTLSARSREATLHYQRLPFQVMKPYDITVAGYPYEGELWVTANVGGLESQEGLTVRATLTAGAEELGSCEITSCERDLGRGAIDMTELEPGEYEVKSQALNADGEVLAEAAASYEHFPRPEWWMSEAGRDHTVPVPWTPVEVDADAIRIWGRELRTGGRILPEQIVNQGQEILAGPVSLVAAISGQRVDLADMRASLVDSAQDRAVQEATQTLGGATVRCRATTEFDGMQRFDLTIEPGGAAAAGRGAQAPPGQTSTVESLQLTIPVRREHVHFLLPSNGRFAKASVMGDESWASGFIPQVWVGSDELGLAWFAESDQHWSPKDDETMVEVVPEGDTVSIRANIIRDALVIQEPITITFGLMATPVKAVPSGDPFYYRFGGPTNAVELYDTEKSRIVHVERLSYPGEGNIDPRQGTVEFWMSTAGLAGSSIRDVLTVSGDGGAMHMQYHDSVGRFLVTASGADGPLIDVSGFDLPEDEFIHVALTWDTTAVALYVDGTLIDANGGPMPAAETMAAAPENLKLIFGCHHSYRGYTWFDLDEVRVSDTMRYRGQQVEVPGGPFTADEHTLLLDHLNDRFRPDGQDGETRAAVISGRSGELGGVPSIGCEFVDGAFGSALRIGVQPPRWCGEVLQQWGVDAYNLWSWLPGEQADDLGWPLPLFTQPQGWDLPRMNEAFDAAGVRTSTYMGYMGIGAPTRWSRQFGNEWRREPVSTQPNEPPKGHVFLDCCGNARGYRDYLAAGAQWLLQQQGFDGCYTDGNAHVYPCRNTHHGCGYYDREGTLRPTYPVFGTREYLKRMYRVIHANNPRGYLVNHVSYNIFIPTMSFTDVYYTGEHEYYEDLVKCRVRWQGTQWGIWPILLGADSHTYEPMYYTYGLLHGVSVWPQGPTGRNDMQRKTVNLWRAYDDFGYRQAEWIPWYEAEERGLALPDDDQVKTSLYLHEGREAMLIVGNLRHEVVETQVRLDAAAMGLGGEELQAWNALTGRDLPTAEGAVSVRLRPTSFVLVRVAAR